MKAGVKFVVLKLQQKHVLHSFVKCECQTKCLDIHVFLFREHKFRYAMIIHIITRKIIGFIEILKTKSHNIKSHLASLYGLTLLPCAFILVKNSTMQDGAINK